MPKEWVAKLTHFRDGGTHSFSDFYDILWHSTLKSLHPQIIQEPDQEPESLNIFWISGLQHDKTKNISGFWPWQKWIYCFTGYCRVLKKKRWLWGFFRKTALMHMHRFQRTLICKEKNPNNNNNKMSGYYRFSNTILGSPFVTHIQLHTLWWVGSLDYQVSSIG